MSTFSSSGFRRSRLSHVAGLCAGLCAGLSAAVLSSPVIADEVITDEVIVVTDSAHPMTAMAGARVIWLDQPARIEAELATGLTKDVSLSAERVRHRLREGGAALQQRIADAYQGVVEAWSLGIATLPAVVVDRRYVVYGERDVAKATALIRAYRRAHPQEHPQVHP